MRSVHCMFLAACAALALATPAKAGCDLSVTTGVTSGYVVQDLGIRNTHTAGLVAIPAISCPLAGGTLTVDAWTRTQLGRGVYGRRGFGDEVDFPELTYEHAVDRFTLRLYAGDYWVTPLPQIRGHVIELYPELSTSIPMGSVTLTPSIAPVEAIGVGYLPSTTFLRGKLGVNVPFTLLGESFTFYAEPAGVVNVAGPKGFAGKVWRPLETLTWHARPWLDIYLEHKEANGHHQGGLFMTVKF